MLAEILPADVFSVLIVFVRLAGALMVIPGFGEIYVSPRVRISLAAALTIALVPLIAPSLPRLPNTPIEMLLIVGGEALIGVFIGMAARLSLTALHVGGTIIAFQSSLAFALTVDPAQGTQGALVATLLTLLGVVLIFAGNFHLLILRALVDSYVLFAAGALPPVGDFSQIALQIVARSFAIGFQIAAPFVVFGLVFYIGLGLIARLMPQMQVFFIAMPLQILSAFFLLTVTIAAAMLWFLDHFESNIARFLVPR